MEDSWSWDGSLISLHSSMANSTRANSPIFASGESRDSPESISLPPPAALRSESASSRSSFSVHTPPEINTRPPSPHLHSSLPPLSSSSTSTASMHPLASILLSDLSPPASPAPSASSFPRSGSRSRFNASSGRGRSRTRTRTSGSSVAGYGDEEDSGTSSAEDNHRPETGHLVMPSLTLEDRSSRDTTFNGPTRDGASLEDDIHEREEEEERLYRSKVKLLLLGKTAEDRRTLAALLANDRDLDRPQSSSSINLTYSSDYCTQSSSARSSSGTSAAESQILIPSIGTCGAHVALCHPTSDDYETSRITDQLRRPLEQLERKLERTFPTTESLASLLASSGVGEFDAALYLFSSPPLPSEIASARSISHLLPILPILILPPSPTSKPQKTSALSHAVVQQLDSAGVRWLSVDNLDRHDPRSSSRREGSKTPDICGGPISMLPHDLFVQHPPSRSRYSHPNRDLASTPTTSFPSPTSEPTSLSSSQELPPFSPTFTIASSSYRSSSSRASSTRSLSPSSTTGRNTGNLHRLTLLDLHRLRRVLHSRSGPEKVRRARAETFLEWREVEVAARGFETVRVESLPRKWNEVSIECADAGREGRRGLDFSKRVAERRNLVEAASHAAAGQHHDTKEESDAEDDGDVLDMDDGFGRRRSISTLQDPTTPKPCFRRLPSSSASFAPISTPTPTSSDASSSSPKSSVSNNSSSSNRSPSPSYFPPFPSTPTSSSIVFIPSNSGGPVSNDSASNSSNASILLRTTCDSSYFPSLLRLVGLNLRLGLVQLARPEAVSRATLRKDKEEKPSATSPSTTKNASSQGWWRIAAVCTVVFAAGVVAGVQVVHRFDHSRGTS